MTVLENATLATPNRVWRLDEVTGPTAVAGCGLWYQLGTYSVLSILVDDPAAVFTHAEALWRQSLPSSTGPIQGPGDVQERS